MSVIWGFIAYVSTMPAAAGQPAAFYCAGSQSSHNQALLKKISNVLYFIPQVLFFVPVSATPHLAVRRVSHSVAGPGLVVSSAIASRIAGTKLTSLAETLVFLPFFLQKSHFQTPGRCKPTLPGWMQPRPSAAYLLGLCLSLKSSKPVSCPLGTTALLLSRDGLPPATVQRQELVFGKSRRGSGNKNADKRQQ